MPSTITARMSSDRDGALNLHRCNVSVNTPTVLLAVTPGDSQPVADGKAPDAFPRDAPAGHAA
ncbi:hypothetical protein [Brachybacterium alimentarium]|uniref:hypothetical protein n=1 Tax=Brachybacterium alimentarium TaxID=47845 RepID=UPI0011C04358|nr:hypothetical protein [Brachybacterium alimentarium]